MSGDREMSGQVLLIGAAVTAMVLVVFVFGPRYTQPASTHAAEARPRIEPARPPIPAEADVFRTAAADLAVPAGAARRRGAHRRTLEMFHALRAYPGAPPRVAHGLSAEEFRSGACLACHERGGWVARFASYAPVTPHPQLEACLQCHVPEDAVVGRQPSAGGDALCFECHDPDGRTPAFVPLDWRTRAPPPIGQRAMEESPPAIPHDLQLRGNCLGCHAGPGAVEDIRTSHPERINCRQCHVPAPAEEGVFVRPLGTNDSGGAR